MDPRNNADLSRQGADITRSTTVDSHALVKDALADDLFHDGLERSGNLSLAFRESLSELGLDASLELGLSLLTLQLRSNLLDAGELVSSLLLDGSVDVILVVLENREVVGLLRQLGSQSDLSVTQHLDERLGGLQTGSDDFLRRSGAPAAHEAPSSRGRLCLNHHDATSPSASTRPATTISKVDSLR